MVFHRRVSSRSCFFQWGSQAASWFQKRGFPGAIWVQGFGESVLAVGTPDETDEPANRRCVYVLSAQAPRPSPDLPKAAWTRLQ